VAIGYDPTKSGVISLDIKSLAGGVYVVRFTQHNGRGILVSKMLKLAVIK